MQVFLEPIEPSNFLRNPHLHTIAGHLKPSEKLKTNGKQLEIPVSGEDRLSCHFYEGSLPVIAYLFHGLAGSTDSGYMHRIGLHLLKLGLSVLLVNHRGCGSGAGLAKSPYHSGRAEDLSDVVSWGKKSFPSFTHIAVGFSLSGNALLLLGAKQRGIVQPDFAIAVCPPIDLGISAKLLSQGLNRVYDFKFYRQARRDAFTMNLIAQESTKLPRISSIYNFDKLFTGPRGGFDSREAYYAQCSAMNFLNDISIPTFLLVAQDDPFVPVETFLKTERSQNVHLHIEKFGGHMGFLNKKPLPGIKSKRWMDYAVVKQIQSFLDF